VSGDARSMTVLRAERASGTNDRASEATRSVPVRGSNGAGSTPTRARDSELELERRGPLASGAERGVDTGGRPAIVFPRKSEQLDGCVVLVVDVGQNVSGERKGPE
jgi:hypothetical protein